MAVKHFFQLLRLKLIFIRYSLDELFYPKSLKKLCWLNPFYLFYNHRVSHGKRLRLALQKAGPIFIKFGQILSTRYDALPDDILAELAQLRDRVPPAPGKKIIKKIESAYSKKITELFKSFEIKPLASASIAQVHTATLPNGDAVVVKVLRPKVKKQIYRDIALLEAGAKTLEKLVKRSKKLKPTALVQEIKNSLLSELDLQQEASNASKLKQFSKTIEQCYIPEIHWDYCHENILVMEEIAGVPIQETEKLKNYGINLPNLARTCVEVFFTQLFRDRFFHADLHPGNIFIDVRNPHKPIIELVDFGIAGKLTAQDQRYIAENLLAIINRDYFKVAKLHQESGWIPDNVPLEAFAKAMEKVCEPILDKPLNEISFGELLKGLIQTAKQYHIIIQPQLLLMQKTLVNIEGLCRQLEPNLNIWETAKPIIQRWLSLQVGPKAFLKKLKQQLPTIIHKAPELPDILCQAIQSIDQKNNDHNTTPAAHKNSASETQNQNHSVLLKLVLLSLLTLLIFQVNFSIAPFWLSNLLIIVCFLCILFF